MLLKAIFTAILSFAFATGTAFADTLIVDSMQDQATDAGPDRGALKTTVTASMGEPSGATEAVGEPKISSWEYDDFIVFFEDDRVLHTVAKR
jgi:hypothetical protein